MWYEPVSLPDNLLTEMFKPYIFNCMVESNVQLDQLFTALSSTTRRSILTQVAKAELSIGEIVVHYNLTFAAISKHIKVLEAANLISKRRRGKEHVVVIVPSSLYIARDHLERYAEIWGDRFDKLDVLLREDS